MDYLDFIMAKQVKRLSAKEKEQSDYVLATLVELLLGAKKEGLLHLEETAWEIPETTPVNRFIRKAVLMVVDGTDPDVVKQVMEREIVYMGTESFDGFLAYMALQGIIAMQLGYTRYLFNDVLVFCFLPGDREEVREFLEENEHKYMEDLRVRHLVELPKRFPHHSNNAFMPHIMVSLERLDDASFDKFVNNLRSKELLILMEFAPEALRTRFLEAVPEPVWQLFLEEYPYTKEDELSEALQIVAQKLNEL